MSERSSSVGTFGPDSGGKRSNWWRSMLRYISSFTSNIKLLLHSILLPEQVWAPTHLAVLVQPKPKTVKSCIAAPVGEAISFKGWTIEVFQIPFPCIWLGGKKMNFLVVLGEFCRILLNCFHWQTIHMLLPNIYKWGRATGICIFPDLITILKLNPSVWRRRVSQV